MAQKLSLKTLLAAIDEMAPFSLAETWDNVGLMVGDPAQEVEGILLALDPTEEVLAEAIASQANTLITHHPPIFHPLKNIRLDNPTGRLLAQALQHNISIISCHTNLDIVHDGVSDAMAKGIELGNLQPLTTQQTPGDDNSATMGFGRIGTLPTPLSAKDFLHLLMTALKTPVLQVAGNCPEKVKTVALCGGSGSDLTETALNKGAQVYITAEVKHSVARWAEASDFCVIDAGHFSTENQIIPLFADLLDNSLRAKGSSTPIQISSKQSNPFKGVVLHDNTVRYCH